MKYIRCNYLGKICQVVKMENEEVYLTKGEGLLHKSIIEKQADTIEELCDEFVEVLDIPIGNESFRHYIHNTPLSRDKLLTFVNLKEKDVVYGAIWTDKGLIYVAKMNEKGGWKLL